MSKFHAYFVAPEHKKTTLRLMWTAFFVCLGYALISLLLLDGQHYWYMIIPGLVALYFRLCYSKAAYDPVKDKHSDQYIPYSERPENKHKANRKKKK